MSLYPVFPGSAFLGMPAIVWGVLGVQTVGLVRGGAEGGEGAGRDVAGNTSRTATDGALAAGGSSSAAPLGAHSANEPLQRSLLDYGANPDDLSDLRRAMCQIRSGLARLKHQTVANDTAIETLAAFVKQATQLHQPPATQRTLQSPQMTSLLVNRCRNRESYSPT